MVRGTPIKGYVENIEKLPDKSGSTDGSADGAPRPELHRGTNSRGQRRWKTCSRNRLLSTRQRKRNEQGTEGRTEVRREEGRKTMITLFFTARNWSYS